MEMTGQCTVLISSLDRVRMNVMYVVWTKSDCSDRAMIFDVYVFYSMDYVIDPLDEI